MTCFYLDPPYLPASQCSPVWKTGTMTGSCARPTSSRRLNVVRSGRPEQCSIPAFRPPARHCLNVVRSGRPEQCRWVEITEMKKESCLNVVRSGRPEQFFQTQVVKYRCSKSQCSPVWKTGTICPPSRRWCRRPAGLNVVRSGRPEQWLAPGGGPDKELYQYLRALRPTDPHNNTLLSCHGVKHLVKPLRALPGGDDTTRGLAAAHTTTGPSSGNLRGTPSIRMSASCGAPRSITTTES